MKPTLIVTAAIIQRDSKILCARRAPEKSQGGLWEFPGGKVESDESDEACLARELSEELGIQAKIGDYFATNIHEYADKIVELRAYWVKSFNGTLKPVDHDELRWLTVDQLDELRWAPADIPFIQALLDEF